MMQTALECNYKVLEQCLFNIDNPEILLDGKVDNLV